MDVVFVLLPLLSIFELDLHLHTMIFALKRSFYNT